MTPASAHDLPLHLRIGAKRGAQALNELRIARHQAAHGRPETAAQAGETGRTLPGGKTNFAKPAEARPHDAGHTPDPAKGAGPETASLTFDDLIDVVNPLQHLPVIGDLYREITGDDISAPARVVGGTLYGGPIGAAASLVNTVVEEATGEDIGGHALAFLTGEEDPVDMARAESARPPAPAMIAEPAKADVAPAPAKAAGTAPPEPARTAALPALSPEAFDALLRSVNDPEDFAKANEKPAAPRTAGERQETAQTAAQAADPLTRLAHSLDKYEAAYGSEAAKGRITDRTY